MRRANYASKNGFCVCISSFLNWQTFILLHLELSVVHKKLRIYITVPAFWCGPINPVFKNDEEIWAQILKLEYPEPGTGIYAKEAKWTPLHSATVITSVADVDM